MGRFEIGIAGGLGCGGFPEDVVSALKGIAQQDGILVNDPGQPQDLAHKVWQALVIMLEEAEAREQGKTALRDCDPLERIRGWFADDLRELSKRIRAITDRGYTPHIDDGVLLNAAPLHEILPSWPETKKAWQELERGDYDWAYQAMEYWPDRVKEKCKTNKSFAIAHELENKT